MNIPHSGNPEAFPNAMQDQVICTIMFAVALAASAFHCSAQGSAYFSRNEFENAIAVLSGVRRDVTFEGPLPPGGVPEAGGYQYFLPFTISGLTFSGDIMLVRPTVNGWWLNNYDSALPVTVAMNGPAIAFGADFSSLLSPVLSDFLATLTLDTGTVFAFTAPADPNVAFFGFVTTHPFTSVTFSDGGVLFGRYHEEILDNITAVIVPEPRAFALFVLSALLLGRELGWKRKHST